MYTIECFVRTLTHRAVPVRRMCRVSALCICTLYLHRYDEAVQNDSVQKSGPFTSVGEVDCGWYPSICKQFDTLAYPTILLIVHGSHDVYLYEGDRQHADELYEFAKQRGEGQGLVCWQCSELACLRYPVLNDDVKAVPL